MLNKAPYLCTIPGSVGNKEVKRMLVDSGADVSLIAEDLVPEGTVREAPIPVEGVGKHTKMYDTAHVPITVQGRTKKVQVAIAPIADIPYAAILGTNIPGTKHTWWWQGEPAATFSHPETQAQEDCEKEGQTPGGAGERTGQVGQESANNPGSGPQQRQQLEQEQPPECIPPRGEQGSQQDPKEQTANAAVVTRAKARQQQQQQTDDNSCQQQQNSNGRQQQQDPANNSGDGSSRQ